MGRCIAKLGENQYMCWSSIVDAPVSEILTREEMIEFMVEDATRASQREAKESIASADERGVSGYGPLETVEELIENNRAGENEACITLDEIKKRYIKPEEWMK